ncbi:MAG: hypothetical protein CMI76_02120 [Candidatus Pelagibacter sp.]|nr:hypothetical protein [Candidatus Pelagibacter sp.]
MQKKWKTIKPSSYKNLKKCLKELKKKYHISFWIEDIIKNKKNKLTITKKKINLYRIKVSTLGFKKPTTLKVIYKKFKEKGYQCVPPDIALRARFIYPEQKTGEWLRFATPMKSMIDSDNVPHLPKLGKALGEYFIETYWSYPKAIFHPHNEFVVTIKNDF